MFKLNINIKDSYPFLYLKDSESDFSTEVDFFEESNIQVDETKIVFPCSPWYENITLLWISINDKSEQFEQELKYLGKFKIHTPSHIVSIQEEPNKIGATLYMKLPCQDFIEVEVFLNDFDSPTKIGMKIFTGVNYE